ncbi:type II toxin-antitoxin system YafQ family toxin [Helicobacter sp. 23-1045]
MKTELENAYKRDYKRILKQGIFGENELFEFDIITKTLLSKEPLDKKYKDHALKGDYKGYRDCHISSDLVLVYKIQNDTLYLSRIGRHRDIFKKYS